MKDILVVTMLLLVLAVSAVGATDLPLQRVVLFYSGVGYFEHQGLVEGNCQVALSFRVEQINDLLKSLVLQDLSGGTIAPVTYAPQDPLARTLEAFSVDLADNPSLAQLLLRLRGSEVTLRARNTVRGVVLGIEEQTRVVGEEAIDIELVNVLTESGIVAVPILDLKSVELADPELNSELKQALAAIAASRQVSKRDLTLNFLGRDEREVRVGYLLETPVWKTTYRLVADEDGLFLQGWAIVENTTDSDWQEVSLALVSGRPISFTQDLYEPVYAYRPEVPVSLPGIVMPRTYEGALYAEEEAWQRADAPPGYEPPGPRGPAGAAGMGMGAPPGMAPSPLPARAAPKAAYGAVELAEAGVEAAAAGEEVGELFQYLISQPVTIGRHQSAMIPIVNQAIAGEKLSVYTEDTSDKYPLNGIRLENNTGLHLMGGPITVFDGGTYAGDALIQHLGQGDQRLLTYAVDLGVEVDTDRGVGIQEQVSVKIDNGVLIARSRQEQSLTYTLKNRTEDERTVLIEHRQQSGWELIEPEEPEEETRDYYRFKVVVPPGATEELTVKTERPIREMVALLDADRLDQINFYLRSAVIGDEVKAALQEIVRRRAAITAVARDRSEKEARLKQIAEEQDRIRRNMGQLGRDSALYQRYVDKMTVQEDEFEALRADLAELRDQENQLADALNEYIRGLNLE